MCSFFEAGNFLATNVPVALLLVAILHFIKDEEGPARIVAVQHCDTQRTGGRRTANGNIALRVPPT
jgi:hypothetical protein